MEKKKKAATESGALLFVVAAIDSKQTDKLAGVEAADLEMKTPMGPTKGTEAHAQMTKMFAAGFPNFKHTISRCVESGDTIACEGKWAGDHTGPFAMPNGQSVPATNKHVEFEWAGFSSSAAPASARTSPHRPGRRLLLPFPGLRIPSCRSGPEFPSS